MSEIVVKNLSSSYKNGRKDSILALKNLSGEFLDGYINVILGPSGCGKTTLLKVLLGLKDYDGDVELDGNDILYLKPKDRNFAFVSQKIALYPKMTIFENIAFPLVIKGYDRKDIVDLVNEIAEELKISECLSRKPKHISIGQAQRAALGRALVKNAAFYFFDEPLSNIDEQNRVIEMRLIKELIKKRRASAIYVTHSLKEALFFADKIFVMDEGNFIFDGTPEEFLKSKEPKIKEIIESSDE